MCRDYMRNMNTRAQIWEDLQHELKIAGSQFSVRAMVFKPYKSMETILIKILRGVRPAYPERGGASPRRSRRRGRSRLQEPFETESPAAAVGGTHRQIHSATYNLKTVGERKSYW